MEQESKDAFFVAGGTVPSGAASYVERSADRELYEALLQGDFCYVLNSRQMGKSSLAVRTIGKLNAAGVRTAFVDLTRLGGATVSGPQWYTGLLVETGRPLGLRSEAAAFVKATHGLGPAQSFLSFLHEVVLTKIEGPVVVMIDEIDAVRGLSFSTDELFAGIRQLHNGRASDPNLSRLTFCLLGAALPSDLIRDSRATPFNVGQRIELRDFTPEEAKPFGRILGEERLARVLYWTGGHPFLTQAICAELIQNPSLTPDELVRTRYLNARARETDTNLADVGRRLLGEGNPNIGPQERADTLSLYDRMLKGRAVADDESNLAAGSIKMSGVAQVEGGLLRVRNHIYGAAFDRNWIRANMPGQERIRQMRAFWRGALRTGLVSVVVLTVVGGLAWNNGRLSRLAEQTARSSSYDAYLASMSLLPSLWDASSIERLQTVLERTANSPNRGWEWEYWHRKAFQSLAITDKTVRSYGPALSPDGRYFASRAGSTITLLNASDLSVARTFQVPGRSIYLTWTSDGKMVTQTAADGGHGLYVDPEDGKTRDLGNYTFAVASQLSSPDGKLLACATPSGQPALYDLTTGRIRKMAITGTTFQGFVSVAFSPTGKECFWAAPEPNAKIKGTTGIASCDPLTGKLLHFFSIASPVFSLRVNQDGSELAAGTMDGTVLLFDLRRGQQIVQRKAHEGMTLNLSFSSDGKRLGSVGYDSVARVFRIGKTGLTEIGSIKGTNAITLLPNSENVAISYWRLRIVSPAMMRDEQIPPFPGASDLSQTTILIAGDKAQASLGDSLWQADLDKGRPPQRIESGLIGAVIGNAPDLVLSSRGSSSVLRDIKAHQDLFVVPEAGFENANFVVSGDRRWLITRTSGDHLDVWDLVGRKHLKTIPTPNSVTAMVLSPDERRLALGHSEGTVDMLDTATWNQIWSATPHYVYILSLKFSADGKHLLAASDDDDASIIDPSSGRTLQLLVGHGQSVSSIDESPDGKRVVTSGMDGAVKLWDPATGQEITNLDSNHRMYKCVRFSQDGTRIYGVSGDGQIGVWNSVGD